MAAQPTAMSSRNWMMRRLIIDIDPQRSRLERRQLHDAAEERAARRGVLRHRHQRRHARLAKLAPTREAADKLLDERLAAPFPADANDMLYQWDSSRDYNPSPGLERITASVLAINSADDERNPPETGVMEAAMKRVKNGRLYLIPASDGDARPRHHRQCPKFYTKQLAEFLQDLPAVR